MCFWKNKSIRQKTHFRKNNLEVIFKRDKTVFYENNGVHGEIFSGAGRKTLLLIFAVWFGSSYSKKAH